ncbi:hypothetical protein OZ411_33465 [Bradyrhizobium sp. Arg237L]|nr:hypothetical protein [Bradyrhizobium sp. Arg237L]MDI4237724.1 hypothetical protein [Bradyrhizobium sp. Arg237L]
MPPWTWSTCTIEASGWYIATAASGALAKQRGLIEGREGRSWQGLLA